MLKRIKPIFITLGIASGMTAAALMYLHNVPQCRTMVLRDMAKQVEFQGQLARYQMPPDFLTALTEGR